ncbi:MAG TPA: signal peptidase II, partial [Gammaproteobacteria bacterium]
MARNVQGLTLFLALLGLDQLAKLAARQVLPADNPLAGLPFISLADALNPGTLFGIGAAAGAPLRWGALALAALLLLALAWGVRRARTLEGAEGPGWWLALAGLAGNLVDRAWHGGVIEYLHVTAGGLQLSLNLADLLLLAGLLLLLRDVLVRMRTPSRSLLPLSEPPPPFPDLGTLPRGIDNVRIDVRLSPQFVAEAKRMVGSLMYQQVGHERYGAKPKPPSRQELREFRGAYAQLLTGVTRQAKRENRPHPVVLMQFAVMKYLYQETAREFDHQLGQLRGILAGGSMESKGGRKMLLHQHISQLGQRRRAIELDVRRQLADETLQVEAGPGAKLRESLLGQRWLVDEAILFNPLLAAADPHDPQAVMRHYVLLGKRTADWESLRRLEGFLERMFDRAVANPTHAGGTEAADQAWLAGSDWAARAERFGLGLAAPDFAHNPLSDVPSNVDLLCNPAY